MYINARRIIIYLEVKESDPTEITKKNWEIWTREFSERNWKKCQVFRK